MWLSLQLCLFNGWIDIPELQQSNSTKYSLIVSFILTLISLVNKIVSIITQSKALKENSLVYMMHNMTAKSAWIPFERFMIEGSLTKCIDFSSITAEYPLNISKVTGMY